MKDKIKGKIDKHYPIYVDGRKCLILNFRVRDGHLTLITKIKNSDLAISGDAGEIVIEKDGVRTEFNVERCPVYYGITIFEYGYHILEERRTVIGEGEV